MTESLYDLLGVAKTVSADELRKAYRKLARKHHPDVNPGDKRAEERFKKISAAYDVLSDEKKRAAYDEFGDDALSGSFDPDKARAYKAEQERRARARTYHRAAPTHDADDDGGPVEFDLSELFGRARGPVRGPDIHAAIEMDLRQAIAGAEVALDVPGHGTMRVRIPPGADDGSVIRLAGKGAPGVGGGPAGDLVIETAVRAHPHVRRDALDLYLTLPITIDEAYNGASIDVPTFEGTVVVKVPPRSQNRAKLRLKGKGIPRKDTRGDLYVELDVRMPDQPDDALAAALRAADAAYSSPVRQEVVL
jgi:DnaJ-class molecular chaperone